MSTKVRVHLKRAYETPAPVDGLRVLVDRHWPRGEAERAGARGFAALAAQAPEGLRPALRELARTEAHWCACLGRHVQGLGGTPSGATGAFYDKLLLAAPTLSGRLELLVRGQDWVTRHLGEALPRVFDPALGRDLEAMHRDHQQGAARCADLARQA